MLDYKFKTSRFQIYKDANLQDHKDKRTNFIEELIEYLDTDEHFDNDSLIKFKESRHSKKFKLDDSMKHVKAKYNVDDADKYLNELTDSLSL